ncbi:MAG: hypothetical protein HY399_00465 [Elusimicrobia bacterium]|nr:hypothetical protein [Elusimicrobiota bacterium]
MKRINKTNTSDLDLLHSLQEQSRHVSSAWTWVNIVGLVTFVSLFMSLVTVASINLSYATDKVYSLTGK